MEDSPRSNRPTPRTPAAIEAELRRRVRTELTQARAEAEGELTDAALAVVIARAIGAALGWHFESPEHTRQATLSSRTWRAAGGPRGGGRREFEEREERPPFQDRGPRQFDQRRPGPYPPRGPRDFDAPFDDRGRPPSGPRPPRDFDAPFDDRGRPPSGPRGGGGFGPRRPPSGRGGFGPRKPRRG